MVCHAAKPSRRTPANDRQRSPSSCARARHKGGTFVGTRRYRPQQWDEVEDWRLYPLGGGERWFGLDAVRDLDGLPPEILLVPLAGHTWGHAGVAIREEGGWLLHAGDAYFYRGEVGSPQYSCTPIGLLPIAFRSRSRK